MAACRGGVLQDHLSALRFPEFRYYLVETPREDGLRARDAARCLGRRIAAGRPFSELHFGEQKLLGRLNRLYEGILAHYGLLP